MPEYDRRFPTPAEMLEKRRNLLEQAFTPNQRDYLPTAIQEQLDTFTESGYPANAVDFLKKRVEILERAGLPPAALAVDRSALPVQTAREKINYPVIDYLAVAYPRATVMPLRQLAAIERGQKIAEIDYMDPIIRRQLAQQGLLEYTRTNTRLDPRALDMNLRCASRVEHIFGIIRTAERCHGSAFKTDLFIRTLQDQLADRIQNYDEQMLKKFQTSSDAAGALRELTEPTNIKFLQDHIHETAGEWVDQKFPHEAPIAFLQAPTIEQYLQIFDSDPFWFADWPEQDIQKLFEQFRLALPEYIQGVILWNQDKKSVSGLAASAFPSERTARHIEMYTGTSLNELVAEQVRQVVSYDIDMTQTIIADTIGGGEMPSLIKNIISEMIAELKTLSSPDQAPAKGEPVDEATPSNVVNLAAYRAARTEKFKVEPHTTVSENLKFLLETIVDKLEFIPPEFRARYFKICQTLDRAYIQAVLQEDTSNLQTSDLYTPHRSGASIFYDLFRMNRFILGNEDQALTTIHGLIDDTLEKKSDPEFVGLFNTLYTNYGRGPFPKLVFGEKYTKTLTVAKNKQGTVQEIKEYPNPLPKAQQRLIHLLGQQPALFSEPLRTAYGRWNTKQNQ